MTKVYMIESERGWGQKIDDTLDFPNREEAIKYCEEYNEKHNPPNDDTPDWYMYAQLEGEWGMRRSSDKGK